MNDTALIAIDDQGAINGEIFGATSSLDLNRGRVLSFDGDNDYVNLKDINEMDQTDRLSLSLWFKRNQTASGQATNHGVDNVLVAQSSSRSNDNLEIGTQGSDIEIYIDSGTAATDQTVRVDAGISNGVWYHLAVVYGTELTVFLDGVKINTWTQYNGRLESSGTSPITLGAARPSRANPWGDFSGEMHRVQLFYDELSPSEIQLLATMVQFVLLLLETSQFHLLLKFGPASQITDSNATISYELISYDGAPPELILYWGSFDHGENAGSGNSHKNLGSKTSGVGNFDIGGFSSGDTIFYQVQAKGLAFSGLV